MYMSYYLHIYFVTVLASAPFSVAISFSNFNIFDFK